MEKETREVSIVKEKDQLAVRIPKKYEEKFQIDPKQDKFLWVVHQDEEGISFHGKLIKNAKKKNN